MYGLRFAVKLTLDVRYPDEYPDVLPELELEPLEGDFEDEELDRLRAELQTVVRNTHYHL